MVKVIVRLDFAVDRQSLRTKLFSSVTDVLFDINLILLAVKLFVRYIFLTLELSFIDVDECMINTHNCDINAVCNNTEGSHNCTCKPGYSGDGISSCTGNNVFLFLVFTYMIEVFPRINFVIDI